MVNLNRLENSILKNLIYNEEYARKVLPFINTEYFSDNSEKNVFVEIKNFVEKYKALPTYEALVINFTESKSLTEEQVRGAVDLLKDIHQNKDEPTEIQWLTDQTEKFCQDKAIYNAIMESVSILDSKANGKAKGEIPKILSDALGVSFDNHVGHDYIDDYEERYEFYHQKEERIPFDLDYFNKITKGGLPNKTLNIALAGTGVGKSLFMCHVAASCISQGFDVLYITLEMAEEKIAERIDANLLNVSLNDLMVIPKEDYVRRFKAIQNKTRGKLIIKEYPTASANAMHFRSLLNELNLKKGFVPDVIMVDYLNICASARIKPGNGVNSYTYIKAIAEELRGLAVEYNVPIWSATQLTRGGYGSTDPDLTDTSESFGLPATADFFVALIVTEQLEQLNQIMVKQLKNRYADPSRYKRDVIGLDKTRMKLYDVEQSAKDIVDTGEDIPQPKPKFENKNKFKGLKV